MNTKNHINPAERLGRSVGRGWRGYARGERRVSGWLIAQGVPAGAALALLWGVKLAVLGVLLYVAFWLALLLLFVVAAVWMAREAGPESDMFEPEWRTGASGFGLYRGDVRVDIGDPNEDD